LGGALVVAGQLPGRTGAALATAAREAFTHVMRGAAVAGALVFAGAAVLASVTLRRVRVREEPCAESAGRADQVSPAGEDGPFRANGDLRAGPPVSSDQVDRPGGVRAGLRRQFGQHPGGHRVVDRQYGERLAADRRAGHLHAGDVDTRLAEDAAHGADDTRTVLVAQDDHVVGKRQVHVVLTDGHDLLHVLGAGQRAGDRDLLAVGEGATHGDDV